jgi:hypothetical protein
VIEARTWGSSVARIVAGHPCRAEVEGEELLIGTEPLVAQVGNSRWSGVTSDAGTTLRRDGQPIVRIRELDGEPGVDGRSEETSGGAPAGLAGASPHRGEKASRGIVVFDPNDSVILHVSGDGAVANARGEILRRAQPERAQVKIGDSVVLGTTDVALAVLMTAPELVPEVRGLAACQRLFAREQATRK